MDDAFIRRVRMRPSEDPDERQGYPWDLGPVRALAAGIALHPKVTYLIGENGSGKSTLLEAIAVAAGMNPEGGGRNFAYSTRESHSPLADALRLVRGVRQPRTDFFLRAESLFTAATYVEDLPTFGNADPLAPTLTRSFINNRDSFLERLLDERF